MKRLLQNRATLEMLCPDGTWTRDVALAWQFKSIEELIAVACKVSDKDLQVLMLMDDEPSGWDVVVSLGQLREIRNTLPGS